MWVYGECVNVLLNFAHPVSLYILHLKKWYLAMQAFILHPQMEVNVLLKLKTVEWSQLSLPLGVGPLGIHESLFRAKMILEKVFSSQPYGHLGCIILCCRMQGFRTGFPKVCQSGMWIILNWSQWRRYRLSRNTCSPLSYLEDSKSRVFYITKVNTLITEIICYDFSVRANI